MKQYLLFQRNLFMNKIFNTIILGTIIFFMSNCTSQHDMGEKGISFVYLSGEIDTSIPISCDNIRKQCEFLEADTVIITYREYTDIHKKAEEIARNTTEDEATCDVRILVSIDSVTSFCVSVEQSICGLNRKMNKEDSLFIYKIKSLSSYYNFYSKEGLSYDPLVKKYGIPVNYHPVLFGNYQKRKELIKVIALYAPEK